MKKNIVLRLQLKLLKFDKMINWIKKIYSKKGIKLYFPLFFNLAILFILLTCYLIIGSLFSKPKIENFQNIKTTVNYFIKEYDWFNFTMGKEGDKIIIIKIDIDWLNSKKYVIKLNHAKKSIDIGNPTLNQLEYQILILNNNDLWRESQIKPKVKE